MSDLSSRVAALEETVEQQAKQISALSRLIVLREGNICATAAALRVLLRVPTPREQLRAGVEREMDEFVGRFMGDPGTPEAMLEGFYWTSKLLMGALRERPRGEPSPAS